MLLGNIILSIIFISLAISYYIYIRNSRKNTKLKNFPFWYRGKKYWYSRSCATVLFIFCKNAQNEWCVLANKRGKGTPDFQGYWNVPCGYMEHDVSGEENATKEAYEECGIFIAEEQVKLFNVETSPKANKQNISLRYYAILKECTTDFNLNSEHSEKNEVSDIKWIPLNEIDNYQWAFNHDIRTKEISSIVLK